MELRHEELATALAGRYDVERELDAGGMAVVYLARDLKLGRKVALKVLRPELAHAIGVERFLQEILITAPLVHPNILPIYDSGEVPGFPYYVMPYVDGATLRQRLEREVQLPIRDAVAITRQVAAALDYAHAHGVVHRDIKPENILLLGDHVLVADFGLARALTSAASRPLTSSGIVVGTAPYMSPEQCTPSAKVDARSDIYSLGCVVFEMVAGMPPFRAATVDMLMRHHQTSDPPSACAERRSCPAGVDAAVRRALAKAPADRFRSAGEFAAALDAASLDAAPFPGTPDRLSPATPRAPLVSVPSRWSGRKRWAVALVSLAIMLAALGLVSLSGDGGPPFRLGERDWVLVADFEGPAGDPTVPLAVRELITAELNQSPSLRTVTRQQLNSVMRLAGVAETTHVDAELARQLAVRSAVRAIVAGNVQHIGGGRYSVALHVVSADDGRNLFSLAESAMEQDLVRAIGDLGREARRKLGERRKDIEATMPLLEAATPSFPAYRKYVEGLARARTGDVAGANALLRSALELDPEFASAWAAIGTHFLAARELDSAQHAFARALEVPGRLTEAQQYRLKGDIAYSVHYDVPAAIRWYDLYLAEYPRAVGGRNNRALYVSAVGRYGDAVADLRAAIDASPFGPAHVQPSLFNLAAMLVSAGRLGEAEAATRDLRPPLRWGAQLLIAVARDQWPRVQALADSIDADAKAPAFMRLLGTTGRASALAATGSAAEAARVLRRARDASSGATARWYERADMLLTLAGGGRPIAASSPAAAAAAAADSSAGAALVLALRAAVAEDTLTAQRHLRQLEAASSRQPGVLGNGPALVRGWIAAAGGRWDEVARTLGAASLAGEHDATLLDRVSSAEVRWLVANAYISLGKRDSAAVHLTRAIAADRVPAGHLVLRGLVLSPARRQLAAWRPGGAVAKN